MLVIITGDFITLMKNDIFKTFKNIILISNNVKKWRINIYEGKTFFDFPQKVKKHDYIFGSSQLTAEHGLLHLMKGTN